jgi:hypothetical protein
MTKTQKQIKEVTINGKSYFALGDGVDENGFPEFNELELLFFFWTGSKFYKHLDPQPVYEDWMFESDDYPELDDSHRDMETIHVDILLDDEGNELSNEEIAGIYGINTDDIEFYTHFRDGEEVSSEENTAKSFTD